MIDNFFSWEFLSTMSGATVFVSLFVQFTKGLTDKMPFHLDTKLYVYIISLFTLILANLFTGGFTLEAFMLAIFNALLVAMAAIGGYDTLEKITAQI